MKFRTSFMIAALALVGIFAAVNWNAFLAPTQLTLVFTDFQAPLGLVMLGVVVVLTAAFLLYVMALQTSVLFETRRLTKQLDTQRDLADQAEKSRFIELRGYLQSELQQLQQRQNAHLSALTNKIESVQQDIQQRGQLTENAVAAQIGELDDRLQRLGVGVRTTA
ncbi:hypothetical protein [Herbaspirillum sp. RV1423]|uniref:hypothetical protein n=1 Tax=Herbaspirillum sp. RV1423 TaxID=1443993 RepID=UPI0004ACDB94|nr:hypothetical protein [Herbaspirillum sp. RV1423]